MSLKIVQHVTLGHDDGDDRPAPGAPDLRCGDWATMRVSLTRLQNTQHGNKF